MRLILYTLLLFFFPSSFEGKVVGVKDGDTIQVLIDGQSQTIRLLDIDCPEKNQAFGQKAKKFTSDFCFGKNIKIETNGKDRYGRYLGTVHINGQNLNKALVKAGLAWHYKHFSKDQEYAELENEARAKKVGLWIDPNPIAPWDFRKQKLNAK